MTQDETNEFLSGLEMAMANIASVLTFSWDEDSEVMLALASNGQWIEAKPVEANGENYVCFTTSWGDQICEQYTFDVALEQADFGDFNWLVAAAPILGGGWDTNVFN